MDKCFYSVDGITTVGPVSPEQLLELYGQGKLSEFSIYSSEDPPGGNRYDLWKPVACLADGGKGSSSRRPVENYLAILEEYTGALLAANVSDPLRFEPARLVFVGTDYFSIHPCSSGVPIHYPKRAILSLRECPFDVSYKLYRPVDQTVRRGFITRVLDGEEIPYPEFTEVRLTVPLTIELYHNVIYTGGSNVSVGFGVGVAAVVPVG